ncbi:MAG TPA: hypothetical protein VGG95_11585 [Edaphobacter sp.]|jgi:uncharacterized membrane protein
MKFLPGETGKGCRIHGVRGVDAMDGLIRAGRLLYAVAIFVFGLQCLSSATGNKLPIPSIGPPWTQGERGLAILVGFGMMAVAAALVLQWYGRLAANLLGLGAVVRGLVIYLPWGLRTPGYPRPWTALFELIALGGAALVIGATLPGLIPQGNVLQRRLAEVGRWMFAISLVVFGVQHLIYAAFVAALVPAWIPEHMFWAYFTGVAFLLAAVSLMTKMQAGLAGVALGLMFVLWVIVLHIPRFVRARHDGSEWTSAFVALAMCGASLVMAGAMEKRALRGGL